ncbi:MAG: STAS domain-containing protein [Terriglobales bacterium]
MYTNGPVIVMELPRRLRHADAETFLGELQQFLESDHPRIVLDCSQVGCVDSAGVEMLLRFLREAMERDADLRLAAVAPASGVILRLLRIDGLFQMFETAEEAVHSLHGFPSHTIPQSMSYPRVSGALGDLKAAS